MKHCPSCRRDVQDELKECPYCGVVFAKWKGAELPKGDSSPAGGPIVDKVSGPFLEPKIRFHQGIVISGLALMLIAWLMGITISHSRAPIGTMWFIILCGAAGWIMSLLGLRDLARAKGRSGNWAELALFPGLAVVGLAIVSMLPAKAAPKRPALPWGCLTIIFLLITAIAIPQVIKYVKHSRTSEAMNHVETIHRMLTDWESQNGTFPLEITSIGKENLTFAQRFPEAAAWLTSGDEFYIYSFTYPAGEDGKTTPRVTAKARDDVKVYGRVIISLPTGAAKVEEMSPTM